MDEIKIDKGIPIPAKGAGRNRKYPFREMEIGDSIFTEKLGTTSLIKNWESSTGFKFTTRSENNGRRIWRIA